MKNIISIYLLVLFLQAPVFSAVGESNSTGIELELIVRQKPELIDKYFEITRDTIRILKGVRQYTLLVNMGLDIDIEDIDSQYVTFNVHLITVGSNPFNYANRYRIEKNLPARIDNIPGKNNSVYQLLISPRQEVEIDVSCDYRVNTGDQYKMDPTAYFDLYYIKGGLGDYHWNNIKNYLEAEYKTFREALAIKAPGKMKFYLCPCPAITLNWDKRFGYAIDPGRGNIFSIYSHQFVSTDAILPNMLQLLRLWGYSPPFLVEGLAGYFDFIPYKIKKLKKENSIPPLKSILTTSGYYAEEAIAVEITAASFVKFLADSYGIGLMKKLYTQSDDLTLRKNIELLYAAPLDSLERQWLHYVDTFQLNRMLFDHYAGRASALYRTELQIEYLHEMLKYDASRFDSIDTRTKLATINYQTGRYYDALAGFAELVAMDSTRPVYRQVLANLYLTIGDYDQARIMLDSVYALDSNLTTTQLVKAKIMAIRGDTAGAITLAEKFYPIEQSLPSKIEYLIFLGWMKALPGDNFDREKSDSYLTDATVWSLDMIPKQPNDPSFRLRAGLSYLGLKQYYEALPHLELALFVEQRAYHIGRVLLALGNLYDALGKHDKAVEYYRACLENESSAHDHELSRKYIETPFED